MSYQTEATCTHGSEWTFVAELVFVFSPPQENESGVGDDDESDTSSDSGHSSDDHDISSEDKSSDTADDKSDEDISANESVNEENGPEADRSDILISQIGKRSLSSTSTTSDSSSCRGEKTKTSSPVNVHSDSCVQVASVWSIAEDNQGMMLLWLLHLLSIFSRRSEMR